MVTKTAASRGAVIVIGRKVKGLGPRQVAAKRHGVAAELVRERDAGERGRRADVKVVDQALGRWHEPRCSVLIVNLG